MSEYLFKLYYTTGSLEALKSLTNTLIESNEIYCAEIQKVFSCVYEYQAQICTEPNAYCVWLKAKVRTNQQSRALVEKIEQLHEEEVPVVLQIDCNINHKAKKYFEES